MASPTSLHDEAASTLAVIALSNEPLLFLAADLKVISANAMREVIAETRDEFESKTGHHLTVIVVESGEIHRRIMAGEAFDVAIVIALIGIDVAAVRLGADSRDSIGDDHTR